MPLTMTILLLAALAAPPAPADPEAAALRAFMEARDAAYSRNDAKALAALATDDCKVTSSAGRTWTGRPAFEKALADAFAGSAKGTGRKTVQVETRMVRPDVA